MTIAKGIADKFKNDGTVFKTNDGQSLEAVCGQEAEQIVSGPDCRRWTFPDGSVITLAGDAWDIGYPHCWCWQGAGHVGSCDEEAALRADKARAEVSE